MSILEAVLLGIIQGITEFLPVSSSAHLVLIQQLLKIQNDQTILFDLALHVGTLAAVIWFFQKDLRRIVLSLFGIVQDLFCNLVARGETEDDLNITLSKIFEGIMQSAPEYSQHAFSNIYIYLSVAVYFSRSKQSFRLC